MKLIILYIMSALCLGFSKPTHLSPWQVSIHPLADSILPLEKLQDKCHFEHYTRTSLPSDIGDGTRIVVLRSSFVWNSAEAPTIHISPNDYPCVLYVNGDDIYRFGVNTKESVATNYRSFLIQIPRSIYAKGTNEITLLLFPRGNRSAPPTITVDTYLPNSSREYWQTSFNFSFIVGHWITGLFIAGLFIAFWIASHRERKDFLYFGLSSFFLAMAYINVVFGTPAHNEPTIWIIARSSMAFAAVSLMVFVSYNAGTHNQFRIVNRLFVGMATIFFLSILFLPTKYEIDSAFAGIANIILTPALLLTFYHSMRKLIKSKSIYDFLIVIGVVICFGSGLYDLYFFKNSLFPFCWMISYGYAFLEIAIILSLTRDLWKLFREDRKKTVQLEERNYELTIQKSKLEHLSEGKSRFLSSMAHEFKTPLQGIVSIVELLQQNDSNHESLKEIMSALNIQMQEHLYNIQNVIDLSILEDTTLEIGEKQFEFNTFISNIEMMFTNNEYNRQNSLRIIRDAALPVQFYGAHDHIVRILINILTNMNLKDISTEIRCSFMWHEENEMLEIRLNSSSGTIHPRTVEILNCVGDTCLSQYSEETHIDDLALFVSSRLIGVLCGSLQINESAGELILAFPMKKVHDQTPRVKHCQNRILVAEDNPVNRMLILKIIEKLGYEVISAENGEQAVQLAMEKTPSLIFMDVQMPALDGLEATRKIREIDTDVVIIALTANANRHDCIEAGMNDFLSKPAHALELKKMIDLYVLQ